MNRPVIRRWGLRAGAVVGVGLFLGLMVRFWHPVYRFTVLLQLGSNWEDRTIAAFREHPVFVHDVPDDYDGLQYAQIACHPLLDDPELPAAVDSLPYRGRRILLPATAWLLAAGRPAWIPSVYAGLNLACWLILAGCLWRLLPVEGGRGLTAWLGILFSAGALGSVRFALTDLPATALIAAALWAAERARPRAALGWLAAAALTRETALLAWPGLCTGPWNSWRRIARDLALALAAAAPLLAWIAYVQWRVGDANAGWANFSWPGAGLVAKLAQSLGEVAHGRDLPFSWGTLLAVASLVAQAAFIATRLRPGDRWWRVGAAHVLLLLTLGPSVWSGFPIAAARAVLPLTLACNLLAVRTRAPLVWLLLCNLSVVSGLMSVWSVPRNLSELAAARSGADAGVVRLGPGWYGQETDAHHQWTWAREAGGVELVTWPRAAPVTARLRFSLRGVTPRTVSIRAGGREIWRGPVGPALTPVSLPPLQTRGARLELEFVTEAPPVRESLGPQPRFLGFALYDPVLSVSVSEAADP